VDLQVVVSILEQLRFERALPLSLSTFEHAMEAFCFGYQTAAGNPMILFFASTLEECRTAALRQRRELRQDRCDEDDFKELEATSIFRCALQTPDQEVLMSLLNNESDLVEACLVEKQLVAVLCD
jgi:hypothetical protein